MSCETVRPAAALLRMRGLLSVPPPVMRLPVCASTAVRLAPAMGSSAERTSRVACPWASASSRATLMLGLLRRAICSACSMVSVGPAGWPAGTALAPAAGVACAGEAGICGACCAAASSRCVCGASGRPVCAGATAGTQNINAQKAAEEVKGLLMSQSSCMDCAAFKPGVNDEVDRRHKEDGNDDGDCQTADDGAGQRRVLLAAGLKAEGHGNHAQQRCERGHQDGAQADFAGMHYCIEQRFSLLMQDAGKFDNENAV